MHSINKLDPIWLNFDIKWNWDAILYCENLSSHVFSAPLTSLHIRPCLKDLYSLRSIEQEFFKTNEEKTSSSTNDLQSYTSLSKLPGFNYSCLLVSLVATLTEQSTQIIHSENWHPWPEIEFLTHCNGSMEKRENQCKENGIVESPRILWSPLSISDLLPIIQPQPCES